MKSSVGLLSEIWSPMETREGECDYYTKGGPQIRVGEGSVLAGQLYFSLKSTNQNMEKSGCGEEEKGHDGNCGGLQRVF